MQEIFPKFLEVISRTFYCEQAVLTISNNSLIQQDIEISEPAFAAMLVLGAVLLALRHKQR